MRLLTERARREVSELSARIATSSDPTALMREQQWLTLIVDRLRDPEGAVPAADELVSFIGTQGEEGA